MNEEMKLAWLEISDMLGEPTREELDVFLRTWQRASQATRKALAEPKYIAFMDIPQRTWVGLSEQEALDCFSPNPITHSKNVEAKLKEKNT